MRIPGLDVGTARDLLDLGFRQAYELSGRCPESLYRELCARKPKTPERRLRCLRLAVYFAENPTPEKSRLHPDAWA